MTVNYKDWETIDRHNLSIAGSPLFDEASKGERINPLDLYPEFDIQKEETYTQWFPTKLAEISPANNLANLALHYNKVIIPIFGYKSRNDFEDIYGMSVENLSEIFERRPEKFLPAVTQHPLEYEAYGYCDKLFNVIHKVRGTYPPFLIRGSFFQRDLTLQVAARREGIIQTAGWTELLLSKFPELDVDQIRDIEIKRIADSAQMYSVARDQKFELADLERAMASTVFELRSFGYGTLTGFLIDKFHKEYSNLDLLYHLLIDYRKYLIDPLTQQLGGFGNYTIADLERMAFLRVLPLVSKDLRRLDQINYSLFLNSPGARSPVSLGSHKMAVFLRGGEDVNTLNDLVDFAERHKKETRIMSEYRQLIAEGKLPAAADAFRRAGEVYTQIGEEVKQLEKAQRRAKFATYAISGGATVLSDAALYYSEGIPPEWKLVIAMFKDILNFLGIKNIDPKRIVDLMYDAKGWPWYQRGVPYLFWRGPSSNPDYV